MDMGKIKLVRSGGPGGHNGVRSVISCVGSSEFPRIKIGIGRPDGPMPVDRYVLSRLHPSEMALVEKIIATAADAAECVLENGLQEAMNRFNGRTVA